MSKRKFSTSHLTTEQLEQIAAIYPRAVVTVRKPVYKVIAMLLECGLEVPGMEKPESKGLPGKKQTELPDMLRRKQ